MLTLTRTVQCSTTTHLNSVQLSGQRSFHPRKNVLGIANRLKASVDVVHKTFEVHRENGGYTDVSKKRTGRPNILDDNDELYLKSPPESNPSIYLDEIIEKFETIYGIFVSKAIISRFLRLRDFT